MSQVSFDLETRKFVICDVCPDVVRPSESGAFEPVVVDDVGIEALIKGLRLANIEWFPSAKGGVATKNVDP